MEVFSQIGTELAITQQLSEQLEKFVCFLYGFPKHGVVNNVRKAIFWDKMKKKKKVVDLCLLPPRHDNLQYHIMRSNYVAYIFRTAGELFVDVDDPANHRWDEKGNVVWSNVSYPQDISELLLVKHGNVDSENDNPDNDDSGDTLVFEDDLDDDLEDISMFN
jgi:hypothetical protein